MPPKLLLLACFLVFGTIEAKSFSKELRSKNLISSFESNLLQPNLDSLVRKRRDAKSSEESSSSEALTKEEALAFMQFFVALAWEGDKHTLLSDFLEARAASDTNLTLIGWQRVLDEQGNIKEIRTIQLVVPPKPLDKDAANNIVNDNDEGRANDLLKFLSYKDIKQMRQILKPWGELIGTSPSATLEKFDKSGNNEVLGYLCGDELYLHSDGFSVYNKSLEATTEQVTHFVNSLKESTLGKPSILKYDVDGHLLLNSSNIRAQFLGKVSSHVDAPNNILTEAPDIMAQVAYQYPRPEVAKQLAIRFNKACPEYEWRVLVDPEYLHVTRDVAVELVYDNFNFDENSKIAFFVYGVKKGDE